MRATIASIADQAGVSTTTVDRVLNARPGVRPRTRERILRLAASLGYVDPAEGPIARRPPLLLDFLLPQGESSFMVALSDHLQSAAATYRVPVTARIGRFDRTDPIDIAGKLLALRSVSHGVGIVAVELPEVREAIRQLSASGVPVLTMVSDLTNLPRIGYVGVDNRAAGRLAGQLLTRMLKSDMGKVAVFAGSLSYRGHEEREMGFRHILSEESRLTVVELREIRDNVDMMHTEALALLDRNPDLVGIYNIGGGNRGIAKALIETQRAGKVVFIGHELSEYTRQFLLERVMDVVIDQNPRVEARDAIDWLCQVAEGAPQPKLAPIRLQAIFRENIPQV